MEIVTQPIKDRKGHNAFMVCVMLTAVFSSANSQALEQISEQEMSESTGEGIAFLPENFFIRTNDGARDSTGAYIQNNSNQVLDAGYIRVVPVGNVSANRKAVGFDKADVYLYGFSYSQSNKQLGEARDYSDLSSGFGRPIDSWGTEKNPWILQTETETDVPSFNAGNPKNVSYLGINAPDFNKEVYAQAQADLAAGTYDPKKYAAYNLKLSWWGDIFKRDSDVVENGSDGLLSRTRLNATWDGVSLNGSHLRYFQTLNGAESVNLPARYNNTLGSSALLRLNGGDATQLRANIAETVNTDTAEWVQISDGGGDSNTPNLGEDATNKYREQVRMNNLSRTRTWQPKNVKSVLQLSTRQLGTDITNDLSTPALGGAVPQFDPNSGIFMYNPNINLPLGQLYQPIMIDTNGSNISLELARIPNNPEIYRQNNQQYQLNDYETWTGLGSANSIVGADSVGDGNYYGNTCNFHQCGKNMNGKFRPATHGSITIGSTVYDGAKNHVSAYKGEEAIGISFGKLENNSVTQNDQYISGMQYQRRNDVATGFLGLGPRRWQYLQANGWGPNSDQNNWDTVNPPWFDIGGSAPVGPDGQTPTTGTRYADEGYRNYALSEVRNTRPEFRQNTSPINNLGSAAVDGFSLQYYKFTTTN